MKEDYCTWFPERWASWRSTYTWEIIDISWMCKNHDDKCGSHQFFKDLTSNKVVGGILIATVASIACWIKYPRGMKDKI